MKRFLTSILAIFLFVSCVTFLPEEVSAASLAQDVRIKLNITEGIVYVGEESPINYLSLKMSTSNVYSNDEWTKLWDALGEEIVWTSSNPNVVSFFDHWEWNTKKGENDPVYSGKIEGNNWFNPIIYGVGEGTAVVTFSSKTLNKSLSCTITVKETELKCVDGVYYSGSEYQFKMMGPKVKALEFSSSVPTVAAIDAKTGVMKGITQGKTTISCKADNGKTYSQTISIYNPCLSYSNITSYYFTGYAPGCYSTFPIVAKGIKVKSWASSNEKVVKVNSLANGTIGDLEIHGTGKCVVTCMDVNGKIYKCNVNIVGGTTWSGLGGYTPTVAQAKTHGYYNDINSIRDFGTSVFYLVDYAQAFNLGNGRPQMKEDEASEKAYSILKQRYPDKEIKSCGTGDLIQIKQGKDRARIWCGCYYVE